MRWLCFASLLTVGILLPGRPAGADEAPRVVTATASEAAYPDEERGVHRLFDLDDTTSYCAEKKVKIRIKASLSRPTPLRAAYLTLGDPTAWKERPRVKQVFVSVLDGDKVVKRVRHKWPDPAAATEGKVNLDATGDAVVVDLDQVYAGTRPGGLCVSGLRLESGLAGAPEPVDAADLAARSYTDDALAEMLTRKWTVTREGNAQATLELAKRGKLSYKDAALGLDLEGKWRIEPIDSGGGARRLVVELTRVRVNHKKVEPAAAVAKQSAPWRFRDAEGAPPTFVPWIAFGVDGAGALVTLVPKNVTSP